MAPVFDYLAGFPVSLRQQAVDLHQNGQLLPRLQQWYPDAHDIRNNAALYTYTQAIKREYLRSAPPLSKVRFSDKISTLHRALGLHTYIARVQGKRMKKKNEIRIASVFKELPGPFLRMVVVHELAHLRHKDHNKAFYQLCRHLEPDYARIERDLLLWMYATSDPAPTAADPASS